MKLVLASGSPRRRELLTQMGLSFSVRPCAAEPAVSGLSPEETVKSIAFGKGSQAAAGAAPDELILAADTLVYLDSTPLGKPTDAEDAAAMLRSLSGREHRVYTGVALLTKDKTVTFCEGTSVFFRPLSEETIRRYVESGEPMDKAGAYGIQGLGSVLVEKINGDYFNVMGLPVCRLAAALRDFGIEVL